MGDLLTLIVGLVGVVAWVFFWVDVIKTKKIFGINLKGGE